MNNVGQKFLPIGTVVMLKGGSKRVMITGFCSMDAEDQNVMYDYAGCMYPEGFLSSDQPALFNHDQIETVYHLGLIDEEEKQFKANLNALVANMPGGASEPVATPVAPVAPVAPVEVPVPPIGPGLPGYVAPQAPVTPTVASVAPVEVPVPPIGSGLPGYVAPQAPATSTVAPVTSNGYAFDANGNVVAAPQPTVQTSEQSVQPVLTNIQFDENGVVVSA